MGSQGVLVLLLTVFEDDAGERPLLPFAMCCRNHCCFGDGGMRHELVLELDGRDPLTARLDGVLGAVDYADVALGVYGGDRAGRGPAVPGWRRRHHRPRG